MTHAPTGQTHSFAFAPGMTLAQGWELYRKLVYSGADLRPDQEVETRQAFISGVSWVLGCLRQMPDDDEQAIKYLNGLEQEVIAFSAEVAERAAARSHLPPPGMTFRR